MCVACGLNTESHSFFLRDQGLTYAIDQRQLTGIDGPSVFGGGLLLTGSTIAVPKKQRFFLTNVAWLLGTRKDAMKKKPSCTVLFAGAYRTMTSRWRMAS